MPVSENAAVRLPLAVAAVPGLTAAGVTAATHKAYAASTATVNGATTFQTINGFGASEGFGQAGTVMNAASSVRQQALNFLFSPTTGAGPTILRDEIPSDSAGTIERSDAAAQSPVSVGGGTFTASVPARSPVTYAVTSSGSGTTSPSAGASPSPSSGPSTCKVAYTRSSQWAEGFTADAAIADTGTSAVNNRTLKFTFPGDQKVTDAWNAQLMQSGEAAGAANLSYDAAIAPGGTTSFGFQGTWTAGDSPPTAFTLDGAACST